MQFVLLPPPHIELETTSRSRRRSHVTRAERVLNEGGEPPRYANTGQRILYDYNTAEGGGSPVLVPLHHLSAVGPGTAAFSWSFLQQQIQNLNVPGILEALFRPIDTDDTGPIESHRVEDYIEAARRLYTRSRNASDSLSQNNLNFALGREHGRPAGTRQTGEMMRLPYMGNFTEGELKRMKKAELLDLAYNMMGVPDAGYSTKAEAMEAIIQWQDNNPIEQREKSDLVIMANTPILFELDLPGLHPNPLGWPEELVFSMMEVLAKHREHISGLNGETFRREEFLSPSINSNFRFDPDAEIELSWYDEGAERQRRYGLTFNMLREILNYDTDAGHDHKWYTKRLNNASRVAYALLTISDGLEGLEGIQRTEFENISELLGMINQSSAGGLNATQMTTYGDLYRQLTDERAGPSTFNRIGFTLPGGNKHLFAGAANDVATARNRMEFCQIIIRDNWDTFFQYAINNGQGMVKLNVDTTSGLSSMFILRETIKQARTKYNYVASADDTAFIYHLLVWSLDNCLGARRQTSQEKRSIADLFKGIMNNLGNRNEEDAQRNEEHVQQVLEQEIRNANLDAHQEALLIELLLEELD